MNACPVDECGGQLYGFTGYCNKHYRRVRRHGDPRVMKRAPNGAGSLHADGYIRINRTHGGPRPLHLLIVERVLGHALKRGQEVHHVNGKRDDNRHSNLVVCPDRAYHQLLHLRQRALEEGGNANYRRCCYCRKWCDTNELACHGGTVYLHATCRRAAYARKVEQRRTRA